jgi:hypothetical protein
MDATELAHNWLHSIAMEFVFEKCCKYLGVCGQIKRRDEERRKVKGC